MEGLDEILLLLVGSRRGAAEFVSSQLDRSNEALRLKYWKTTWKRMNFA